MDIEKYEFTDIRITEALVRPVTGNVDLVIDGKDYIFGKDDAIALAKHFRLKERDIYGPPLGDQQNW